MIHPAPKKCFHHFIVGIQINVKGHAHTTADRSCICYADFLDNDDALHKNVL